MNTLDISRLKIFAAMVFGFYLVIALAIVCLTLFQIKALDNTYSKYLLKPQENIESIQTETTALFLPLPQETTGKFKSWMDYKAITDKNSKQYKLQQQAYTDDLGLRVINGKPMIAVGTFYAQEIGTELSVHLSTGEVVDCIVGDIKSDLHTDSSRRYNPSNGNIIEFIVSKGNISREVIYSGDISKIPKFEGSVSGISKTI